MGKRHKRNNFPDIPGAELCALAVLNSYETNLCIFIPVVEGIEGQRCFHYPKNKGRLDEGPSKCPRLIDRQAEVKLIFF